MLVHGREDGDGECGDGMKKGRRARGGHVHRKHRYVPPNATVSMPGEPKCRPPLDSRFISVYIREGGTARLRRARKSVHKSTGTGKMRGIKTDSTPGWFYEREEKVECVLRSGPSEWAQVRSPFTR